MKLFTVGCLRCSVLQPLKTGIDDDRDASRMRELAVQSIVEATAQQRASLAERTKTRPAGELLELQTGDLVEFYRPPLTKDVSGWRGPATITDVTSLSDGIMSIRWQGRVLSCRVQDVRRALVYWTFLTARRAFSPMEEIFNFCHHMKSDVIRLGWICKRDGWHECVGNQQFPKILLAGLHVAACSLHLDGCIGFRIGRCGSAARKLEAIAECDDGTLIWWNVKHAMEISHLFHNPTQRVNLEVLFGKEYEQCAFLQFLCIGQEEVRLLRLTHPDVPNLGGMHDPGMPHVVDREHDSTSNSAPPSSSDNTLPVTPRGHTRKFSDASSHNPRTTASPKISTEEREQLEEEAPFSAAEGIDVPVPTDDETFVSHEVVTDDELIPPYYHLNAAEELAPTYFNHAPDPTHFIPGGIVMPGDAPDEPPQLAFNHKTAYLVHGLPRPLLANEELVFIQQPGGEITSVIERTHNVLTHQEALKHSEECKTAIVAELS